MGQSQSRLVLLLPLAIAPIACAPQETSAKQTALETKPPLQVQQIADTRANRSDPDAGVAWAYLTKKNPAAISLASTDRRSTDQLLDILKALPKDRKERVRAFIEEHGSPFGKAALDLDEALLPESHLGFLMRLLLFDNWQYAAIEQLAATNDPVVVPKILDAKISNDNWLQLLKLTKPNFLAPVLAQHRSHPTDASAFVIGGFGPAAEPEIRALAADKNLGNRVLDGLAHSPADGSTRLLLQLTTADTEHDRAVLIAGLSEHGVAELPLLLSWLHGSDANKKQVALEALPKINDKDAVLPALEAVQGEMPNHIAATAAASSPEAVRLFITKHLPAGTPYAKKNALLLAQHLAGAELDRKAEDPLLDVLIEASKDSDATVREQAVRAIYEFGFPQRGGAQRAARRLIQLLKDPAPSVRSEAAIQVSQYPNPQVLKLLRDLAANPKEIPLVKESARTSADSLENTLKHLRGSGNVVFRL